jgi:hypothetical protein
MPQGNVNGDHDGDAVMRRATSNVASAWSKRAGESADEAHYGSRSMSR